MFAASSGWAAPAQAGEPRPTVQDASAVTLAHEALARYQEGRYQEAAELFLAAFRLTGRSGQLWNAAKAFGMAAELDRAAQLFRDFQELPGVDEAARHEAQAELDELANQKAALAAPPGSVPRERERGLGGLRTLAPEPTLTTSSPPAVSEPLPSWLAYGALGAAVVAAGFGAPMLIDSFQRQRSLESALGSTQDGLIVGISHQDAADERASIGVERGVAGGLLTLAVASVSAGVLMLLLGD